MPEKVLRRSVRSVPTEELSESEMEEPWRRMNIGAEFGGRMQSDSMGKSVRTFRPNELVIGTEKQPIDYKTKLIEKKGYVDATESYVKSPKKEMNALVDNVLMETTDEDSEAETEDDYFEGSSGNGEAAADNSVNVNDVGPDVDKKADEFIAKFREQIRLQRIESIRRSTAQRAGKTLR
ncbi:UNVERIFIED_CONTAM: hypothetical protein Scaly_2417700 [Sesamum calycinum]|uniref:Uncharacterized protein n=1 Tax=Sesamum calycinum TaxID=2727403 RepID=A0AAW2M380_9LAMI